MHNRTLYLLVLNLLALSLLFLASRPALAQEPSIIEGKVVSEKGEPMAFVNVQIPETIEGASTNMDGLFSFKTRRQGEQIIQATMIGFEPATATVVLEAGKTVSVNLVLKETLITLDEAVVTASAYATGDVEAVTLESLEVVTTPGAAADILLAIKTFPGVAMVDEGAGLFVRGGDVGETVLLLDQATVAHPYKYETPTGGVFGTIPPFLVGGTFFSSGGFSAKYGNALSGVLSMETQDLPQVSTLSTNVGLAAASLGFDAVVVPGKLGVRFSGNRSFTEAMMRLNGFADEFSLTPRGMDANLSVIYQYSSTGRLKFFNYTNHDRVGVFIDEPSFDGEFSGKTANWLHNVQWTEVKGDWLLESSLSLNRYDNHQQLGVLDLKPSDITTKLRADAEREAGEKIKLRLGAEVEQVKNVFKGRVPSQENILDPNSGSRLLDESYSGVRTGGYVEADWKVARRLVLQIGLRSDYFSLAESVTLDPRLSLRYVFNKHTDLRFAWGLYHQVSSAYTFNPVTGNPELEPQRAQHFIAGLNHEKGQWMARLEAYYKPYEHLVLESRTEGNNRGFANAGDGEAYGIDAFVKYGGFLQTRVNGWVSYSFLHSERRQVRYAGQDIVFERGPSPFDITHNLTVVAKLRLIGFLSTGVTYRYATGRPFTPVVDAIPQAGGAFYLPIEGQIGSERLPDFQRMDMNVSYFLPFGSGHNATFYLAFSNLLNRVNVLDYDYSLDYSTRKTKTSNYRRFVYFGVSLSLNRMPR